MKRLLIVIPAYNEEKNIVNVVENLKKNYSQWDYVVINDGSTDKTAEICKNKGYNLVDLPINLGLSAAFQTGLKYASIHGYEYAIQYDADGQHQAQYIESMLRAIELGEDIVIGSRFVEKKKPLSMRMLGSKILTWAIKLTTGVRIVDPTSGMRMFNRKMIEEFANSLNYGPEPDTVSFLIKNGAKVKEVQVEMLERYAGESYLNWTRSMVYMLRMTISILFIQSFRKREKR